MNIRAKIPIRSTTHQDPLQESSHVAWCFVTNVCLVMGYFDLATTTDIIAFHGEMLNPFGMSHCPLRHMVIKDDCVSRSSHVFNNDVESFTQWLTHAAQHVHSLVFASTAVTPVGMPNLCCADKTCLLLRFCDRPWDQPSSLTLGRADQRPKGLKSRQIPRRLISSLCQNPHGTHAWQKPRSIARSKLRRPPSSQRGHTDDGSRMRVVDDPVCACARLRMPGREGCGGIFVWWRNA